jgi:hypothetical protein
MIDMLPERRDGQICFSFELAGNTKPHAFCSVYLASAVNGQQSTTGTNSLGTNEAERIH